MNVSVNAIKFTMNDEQREFIDKKLQRIKYAEDLITDAMISVKLDKKFLCEATLNFRWGGSAHVSADDYDFAACVNKMMDVLDQKVKKEKDKVQEKK